MSAIQIPGYKIIRTLGVGGQATVYLAVQKGFDREVALKVMSPALAADPSFGDRFIREAKIVAQLSHTNIVTVYDVGQSGNFYYLAMEYLPGADLKKRIADGIKAQDCLDIISKIAVALHFAHAKGYIHRDVKSENILFNEEGEPLLTDFGIAKASNSSTQMTQTGKLIGTPEYMSPEQCRGKKIDGRSDLYSLGIIFYEILTREVPFSGEDSVAVCIKHVTKPMPELPVRLKRFQWFIERLLAKDPEKRFQNGEQLIEAIKQFKSTGQFDASSVESRLNKTDASRTEPDKTQVMDSDDFEQFQEFDDLHTERRAQISDIHPKSRWPKVFAASVFLLALAGFFTRQYWFQDTYAWVESNWLKTVSEKSSNNQMASNEKVESDSRKNQKVLSEQKTPSVIELLQQADALVQFVPQKVSDIKQALKLIATANTLEPNNKNVEQVYQNILNISLSEANNLAEKYNFDGAREWLTLVEYEQPEHQLLTVTKQNVERLKTEYDANENDRAARAQQVNELLQKADLAFQEKKLSLPTKGSAIYYYQEALALDPDNQMVQSGLQKVVNAHVDLIDEAIAEKSYSKAKSYLAKFASLSDDQVTKLSLQKKIEKSETEYNQTIKDRRRIAAIQAEKKQADLNRQEKLNDPLLQMQLASNLDSAKSLEKEALLVEPTGNNALEKYRIVLSIDEKNIDAKAGIERIESVIIKNITTAINNNQKAEALNWLGKLEILDQYYPQMQTYKAQIETMIEPIAEVNQEIELNKEIEVSKEILPEQNTQTLPEASNEMSIDSSDDPLVKRFPEADVQTDSSDNEILSNEGLNSETQVNQNDTTIDSNSGELLIDINDVTANNDENTESNQPSSDEIEKSSNELIDSAIQEDATEKQDSLQSLPSEESIVEEANDTLLNDTLQQQDNLLETLDETKINDIIQQDSIENVENDKATDIIE